MAQQIPLWRDNLAFDNHRDEVRDDGTHEVHIDVAYKRLAIVNIAYLGRPNSDDWVLVDTAIPGTAGMIVKSADERFGSNSKPKAIILTHGHFDHVGTVKSLAATWDVPVYAHELELPYLDGTASYPPPDPRVGGGMMAKMSRFFPRGPVDISQWLHVLPEDGSVPFMPDWRWIHVPGHTPGQVALWRESDRTLIAADAFVTTAQESVYAALTQKPEMHGPPMYYTQDWQASRESVRRLAALEPEYVITGHGMAMQGLPMRLALHRLAEEFDQVAVPDEGRYVANPAKPDDGSAYDVKAS